MVNECTAYVLCIAWSDYLAHPKWTAVIKRHEADGGQKHKTNNSQKGKHVCVRVKDIRTDCQLQTSLKAQLYFSILSNLRLLDKSGSNGFQQQLQLIFQEFLLGVPWLKRSD